MVLPVYGYMENKVMNDKASENIPVMCKIRYTVNRVVLEDINYIYIYTGDRPYVCNM